jgi:tetrahydromethanopterin S-methyltransferase subunit H
MTLPPPGYHARAVTFGCIAKGKGVSSRASLIIAVKVLVGNTVSSGHHTKVVSSGYPLNKKKKKKKKQIKKRIKAKMGLEKIASMIGTTRLLQGHPQVISCIPGFHSTCMSGHPLNHFTSFTWLG